MKKITYPLILSIIISLVLASCGLFNSSVAEADLPQLQATAALPANAVAIELVTQVDTAIQYNAVGQVMRFKYIVKMVRNDLTDATPPNITFTGVLPICPAINTVGNLNDRLETGEIIECTYDYILTQADLDKSSVSNVVTVNAYGVNSNTVTANIPTVPSKLLTVTVTANPTTYSAAGQKILFTYVIKNSGSTQIGPAQFTITSPLINNNAPINCGNADATIAPGASLPSCTAEYTITAADVNSASIATNVTASGGGANPSQQASVTLTKGAASSLTAGANFQHTVVEGEWLWQIARCYGADPNKTVAANPQLSDPAKIKAGMVVTVPNIGSNGRIYAPQPCVAKHNVKSGDTWSSIATQYGADACLLQTVNANTLTVGKDIKVPLYTAGLNIQSCTGSSVAGLSISATASPNSYSQAAQVINLTYVIKNNTASTLGPAQFTVTDPLIGASSFNCGAANTSLAPGATINCNVNYSITQTDANAVSVISNAFAAGGGLTSPGVRTTITKGGTSQLSLTATANPTTYSQVGQIITLTYVIKNNSTASLGPTQFTVTDPLISPSSFNCGPANTTLAPDATTNCTVNYTITQVDMNSASVTARSMAAGGGAPQSPTAEVTILKSVSSLLLTSSPSPVNYNQVGQVITFNYIITNNGTATLGPAQFTVTDILIGPNAFNCGAADTTLAPNGTATCSATYTITQEDMGFASISNSATAAGGGASTTQADVKTVLKQ